jgi:hypothetical protein
MAICHRDGEAATYNELRLWAATGERYSRRERKHPHDNDKGSADLLTV